MLLGPVVATFAVGLVAGLVTGTAELAQLDTSAPEVDALLRAVGFSPYGAVMIWIAVGVRRMLQDVAKEIEGFRADYRAQTASNVEMTRAIRERSAAEYGRQADEVVDARGRPVTGAGRRARGGG